MPFQSVTVRSHKTKSENPFPGISAFLFRYFIYLRLFTEFSLQRRQLFFQRLLSYRLAPLFALLVIRFFRRLLSALHRQRNFLSLRIHAKHSDLYDVADFHHFRRVLYKIIAELGYVYQSVLMHADIDEHAEVDYVSDRLSY